MNEKKILFIEAGKLCLMFLIIKYFLQKSMLNQLLISSQ